MIYQLGESTSAGPIRCTECGNVIIMPCTYLFVQGTGSFHIECAERHGYALTFGEEQSR